MTCITPDVLAHRDELSEFVGDEISRVIEEQRKLETRYEELISKRGMLKGLANRSKYKQNQQEIQEVSRALRESTKNLCRNLKDNPNVTGNLLKIQHERNSLEDLIARTVNEIREKRTFTALAAHVEDTRREQERLKETIEREKSTTNAVRELEEELEHERTEHEKEESERAETITQLKEELQEIRSKLTFKTQYARREAQAKLASTARIYEKEEHDLLANIENLKRICDMENAVHRDTVDFLTQKQESLIEQTNEWRDRYTNDMEELDAQLRDLTETRETALVRLNELQGRWDQQVAEEEAREEEIRRQKELAELRKREEEEENAAAIKIQRRYRAYVMRRGAMKKDTKKGKKGGKKGKKK